MLKLTDDFKDAAIVRSRDPKIWETCDILVDVGAVYNPSKLRFDHHQRGFDTTFSEEHKTKLSSAGLVYKHYGRQVVSKLVGSVSEDDLEKIYQKTYKGFIEAIDGIDNGVSQFPKDLEPAYISRTDLSSRVGHLNPMWNEDASDADSRFQQAMELAGTEFVSSVNRLKQSWLPARDIVKASVQALKETHPSGQIMKLTHFTVWKEHLEELEREMKLDPQVLYVLYEDSSKCWRVQCTAVSPGSFESRKALPEPWRGVRDDKLAELTGIEGASFVHATGFIGGAKTYEGALKMAVASLEWSNDAKSEQEAKKQKV